MNKYSYLEKKVLSNVEEVSTKIAAQVAIAFVGSLIIALSAQIVIPIGIVPVTLQTFAVVLLTLLFGRNTALIAVGFYFLEILSGLPVMSGARGLTPASLMNLGYIVAFIPLSYIIGTFADKNVISSKLGAIMSIIVANAIVYLVGTLWLGAFIGYNQNLIAIGVLPFIIPDIVKMSVAVIIAKLLNK